MRSIAVIEKVLHSHIILLNLKFRSSWLSFKLLRRIKYPFDSMDNRNMHNNNVSFTWVYRRLVYRNIYYCNFEFLDTKYILRFDSHDSFHRDQINSWISCQFQTSLSWSNFSSLIPFLLWFFRKIEHINFEIWRLFFTISFESSLSHYGILDDVNFVSTLSFAYTLVIINLRNDEQPLKSEENLVHIIE